MSRTGPTLPSWARLLIGPAVLAAGLSLLPLGPIDRLARTATPSRDEGLTRQVTLFGIRATPGSSKIDPELLDVAPQLRKLLPNHGFRLLGAANKRAAKGQRVLCELGGDQTLAVEIREIQTAEGKVLLAVRLERGNPPRPLFETEVATPPNQLCFLEKDTAEGVLLIGLGAR